MANIITGIRIVCSLGLIFCPTFSKQFYILYVIGGISDVLDGAVARFFKKETRLGAQLDTVADIVFSVIVIVKTVRAVYIPLWIIIWIVCIAAIKTVNFISGFIIYKRLITEHTVMNKICGILLFVIPLCISQLSWRYVAAIMIFTCLVSTFSALQEWHYIRAGKEIN